MPEDTTVVNTLDSYNKLFHDKFGYYPDDMEEFYVGGYAEPVFGAEKRGEGLGTKLRVHPKGACQLPDQCVIHNPSDHHMRIWPLNYRADRGLMERTCPHGVGHPDPDDIAFKASIKGEDYAHYEGIHGCDGCCSPT